MRGSPARGILAALVATILAGCGSDVTDPTDPVAVTLGETTFVVVGNPIVNDANLVTVPVPGLVQSGIDLSILGGPSVTTGAGGVGVLAEVSSGTQVLSASSQEGSGELTLGIAERDLREVAVALDDSGAAVMADVLYAFGGRVIVVLPTMTEAEVNAALAESNLIVLFRSGTYSGNLQFAGNGVTLFGEGPQGGLVTIDGSVVVTGDGNRVRGTRITGDLSVPGINSAVSFSSVVGSLTVTGDDAVLLNNEFCGSVTMPAPNVLVLGNAGLDPIPAPTNGC